MVCLALLPQFHLWVIRGDDWQGTFVSFDFDEVAYASYLNALIDGRPRRNDPYTGRDDSPQQPRAESLHSIQFLAAYAAALPARALGFSAGTTFIIIRALAAFASTLALFWLLLLLTRDQHIAVAGAVIVLCLGGIAGETHNAWRIITLRGTGESLPFLRGYVPALVFPLFFLLVALVWQALQNRAPVRRAAVAGVALAILIFSYFFLWTATLAWLVLIALLWLSTPRKAKRDALLVFGIIGACAAITLVPYALLLARRAPSVDSAQLLTHSRMPTVSLPVMIGLLVLIVLVIAVRWRWLSWSTPSVLFTASFALLPVVTFNQQVITGLLLQPVHYGRYVANYAGLLAVFLALVMIWDRKQTTSFAPLFGVRRLDGALVFVSPPPTRDKKRRLFSALQKLASWAPKRKLLLLTLVIFGWAMLETGVRSARFESHNIARDEAERVAWRLRELSTQPRTSGANYEAVVFSSDILLGDTLPNVAPQPVLWTPHLFVFSGASAEENRERLYQQLYYSGTDEQQFAALAGSSSFLQLALFGWERMNQKTHTLGITSEDVRQETLHFAEYVRDFDARKAATPTLEFVVVPAASGPSLTNLDRWYERDVGERVGDYVIYRSRRR
ncbi:MAG: hypothetical protein ACR2H6_09025 [Pyrinomonadaceae bacterium]